MIAAQRSLSVILVLALLSLSGGASASIHEPDGSEKPRRHILRLLAHDSRALYVAGVRLDVEPLRRLYASRDYRLIWNGSGRALRRGLLVRQVMEEAASHGLRPAEYRVPHVPDGGSAGMVLAKRDLLLSDAVLRYARHLRNGRVDPHRVDPSWSFPRDAFDAPAFVAEAVAGDLGKALETLPPDHAAYRRLREWLARYRAVRQRGGWGWVPGGPTLTQGMADRRVVLLRRRLAASGDLISPEGGERFDAALAAAVRRFQSRHGLMEDGAVGPATLAALNVPLEARIRRIEANLERWRWLPRALPERRIEVNAASYRLALFQDGVRVMEMPVIVGSPGHATPSFTKPISSVVVNPPWTVPRSIASTSILARLREDPGYLARNGFRIVGARGTGDVPKASEVDWSAYDHRTFPFTFRQRPGPDNALGRIKFDMPGPNAIYLHDTPHRDLFASDYRARSHGCIRVQRPLALASILLGEHGWDASKLSALIAKGATRWLRLPRSMPVLVWYFPVVAEAGRLRFHEDVYGRDEALIEALAPEAGRRSHIVVATDRPTPTR